MERSKSIKSIKKAKEIINANEYLKNHKKLLMRALVNGNLQASVSASMILINQDFGEDHNSDIREYTRCDLSHLNFQERSARILNGLRNFTNRFD
jgi:hypothetical protein